MPSFKPSLNSSRRASCIETYRTLLKFSEESPRTSPVSNDSNHSCESPETSPNASSRKKHIYTSEMVQVSSSRRLSSIKTVKIKLKQRENNLKYLDCVSLSLISVTRRGHGEVAVAFIENQYKNKNKNTTRMAVLPVLFVFALNCLDRCSLC
jgi:hypothetical protein